MSNVNGEMKKYLKIFVFLSLIFAIFLSLGFFVSLNEDVLKSQPFDAREKLENQAMAINEQDESEVYSGGEIIVSIDDTASIDEIVSRNSCIERVAKSSISNFSSNTHCLKLKAGISVSSAAKYLVSDHSIQSIQPNYIYYLADENSNHGKRNNLENSQNSSVQATEINDELYKKGYQWSLNDNNSEANIFDAWDVVKTNKQITVATIDTGIDTDHPDLVNNIVEASSTVSEEYDPDSYFSAEDFDDHGTHVAGIIAAETNNEIGVSGVSYNAGIMAVRTFYSGFTSSGNVATMAKSSDIAAGIRHVVEMKDTYNVKLINMSIGTANTSSSKPPADDYIMLDAIDEAYNKDIYCIVAAGNDKTTTTLTPITHPAYYDKVISVGAINAAHVWQTWSNGGPELDVVAPGYYIWSTVRKFNDGFADDGYAALSGTSMATPYVAGVSALCMTVNQNLTFDQLYDCLTKTASDLGETGRDDYYGYGQIVPVRAVSYAESLKEEPNPEPEPDPDPNVNLKIYSIHKGGDDKDCFNILIAGDGYTKDQQELFASDAKLRSEKLFDWEPYKKYKNKINIYGVNVLSNESGINKDTYFGLSSSGGRVIDFADSQYYTKARELKLELEKQLNNKAGFGTVHILANSAGYYGASRNSWFSFSSLSYDGTDASVMAHEMAHSIGKLGDEYNKIVDGKYNLDYATKTADDVKWKEFLGFRGVGLALGNASDSSVIIPTPTCLMRELQYQLCEVCKAQMAWYLNDFLYCDNGDDYYAADLDLTIEHSKTATFPSTYKNYQVNNQSIKKANGHTLELRTIFQNQRRNIQTDGDNPFNLALSLVIKNSKGVIKAQKTQDFVVDNCTYNVDKARKSLSVSIDVGENQFLSGYTIEGKLIDKDTNAVLQVFDAGEPGAVEPEPEPTPDPKPDPDPTPDPDPDPTPDPDPDPQPEYVSATLKVSGSGNYWINGAKTTALKVEKNKGDVVLKLSGKTLSNSFSILKSVVANKKQIYSYSNINKSSWIEVNSEYKRRMNENVTMATFDKVAKFTSSILTFNIGKLSQNIEIKIDFEEVVPVYRLYNMITSEHLFTTSKSEYDNFVSLGKKNREWWIGEGIDWLAPKSGQKVYRLYNPALGSQQKSSHYYTANLSEAKNLVKNWGWRYDFSGREVFFSGGDNAIYTCYNELLRSAHHYTSSKSEWLGLQKHGWDLEKSKNGSTGVFRCILSAR